MKQKSAKDLILSAFAQAAEQGRAGWEVMLLSHLKGRILSLSDRDFSESDYGARSFREFVEKCSSIVTVTGSGGRISAKLLDSAIAHIKGDVVGLDWVSPEDEIAKCRERADQLGVGEVLMASIEHAPESEVESIFSRVVSAWASPSSFQMDASSLEELIRRMDEFAPSNLALATIHAAQRLRIVDREIPKRANDLAYRLFDEIQKELSTSFNKRSNILASASATLDSEMQRLRDAVVFFRGSTSVSAKMPSIDVLKASHSYSRVSLPGERALLRELDVVIGPIFRKFCESCERHESSKVSRHRGELLENLDRYSDRLRKHHRSVIVAKFLAPIAEHVRDLLDEGVRREEAFTQPELSLVEPQVKIDLTTGIAGTIFSARLQNKGQGVAFGVALVLNDADTVASLELVDPSGPFDLSAGSDQIISFRITLESNRNNVAVPITWTCESNSGKEYVFEDQLALAQQQKEPNWEELERNPPYSVNPVSNRADLFGRDSILQELTLRGFAGDSTFLWGQKRVGKTSVLQVLERELSSKKNVTCIFLRMGELASLHEGEVAYTIAERLSHNSPKQIEAPNTENFGAGMGRLVPFINDLKAANVQQKYIVIIDEFDEIDSAFYVGERGRQFVKALRSLSEVGLTFFFAGSERMDTIYQRHAEDLNKWTNIALDRIDSREDCKSLVIEPVSTVLEFEVAAVNSIVDYCQGNPFYMHLFCGEIFRQCWKERRTYVGETHVDLARRDLLVKLAPSNFAHLWEDNPELDAGKKQQQAAQNCLVLSCISALGGRYETEQDVVDAQNVVGLSDQKRLSLSAVRSTLRRLRRRKILCQGQRDPAMIEISLPIFENWLSSNAEAHLLDQWRKFCEEQESQGRVKRPTKTVARSDELFPISEDELLSVSTNLVYLGKQKDVAEVRKWLRQFDDDNRIEIAFLLLQRLVSNGFISDGAIANELTKMHDAIQARRLDVGKGAWKIVRKRNDNLCIAFVDSEVKSGGSIARELTKRIHAGKCGALEEASSWIRSHLDQDPILVIADDFTASGATLDKGLRKAMNDKGSGFRELVSEGRVICCVLTAFPEAIQRIKKAHPQIPVIAMRVFGDDVRALEAESEIFEDAGTRQFAKDMLLQLGRELTPQMPLGYDDMGVLVAFHNTVPNNTLPIFWSTGTVNGRPWHALLPRA